MSEMVFSVSEVDGLFFINCHYEGIELITSVKL